MIKKIVSALWEPLSLAQPASSVLWLSLQDQHPARRKLDAHVGQLQCSTQSFFNAFSVPRSVICTAFSKLHSVHFQCILNAHLDHFNELSVLNSAIFNALSVPI